MLPRKWQLPLLGIAFLFQAKLMAQSTDFLSNNGALISTKSNSFISVLGDIHNLQTGHFNNSDTILLTGNWINNASNFVFDSIPAGYVKMWGANQHIAGLQQTHFYNLILQKSGVKFADIDTKIDGYLDLTDRELNADTNTVWVRNPLLNSVRRTTGFLSSLENGGLLRYTNQTGSYFFPVGSALNTPRFRPIELTPTDANLNQYKVRFANTDPSAEMFDRTQKFHLVCSLNPTWYHRIFHPDGKTSVDMKFFFDPTVDNTWNDLAHWQNIPQWQSMNKDTLLNGTPFSTLQKKNWNDFSYAPFALANTSKPFANAGLDTLIWKSDTIQLNASGGQIYSWSTDYNISDLTISNPSVHPEISTVYYLKVANELGCEDYDSVVISVSDKPFSKLIIPDVITPNGDGFNDFWHIDALDRYPQNSVRIINRWGDEILYEAPYNQQWAGTWKGNHLPGGTYYYIIRLKNDQGVETVFDGPITIIR